MCGVCVCVCVLVWHGVVLYSIELCCGCCVGVHCVVVYCVVLMLSCGVLCCGVCV